jgi:adenylate cyclase
MTRDDIAQIGDWLIEAGLAGRSETELLTGFCERAVAAGVPLVRAMVGIDTLHPIHEGRIFRWQPSRTDLSAVSEYGRSTQDSESEEMWRRSPFYRLIETGETVLRRKLARGDPVDFIVLRELLEEGMTDYMAMIHRFEKESAIGQMDSVYSSWTSNAPSGFTDEQARALERLVPSLALAVKSASLARIAETLVETYLGRDAGRRVLSGRIERGVADRIGAVLWYSDLRGFTRITDTADPEQVIPLLNDYAEAVISAVQEAGGDVLKLIGDGVLALFNAAEPGEACRCALDAESLVRRRVAELNERRALAGLPVTHPYLGLHIGAVFYGNIGSPDRLDFTVIGPAVNEVSRIAAMCRSVEREVLVSSAFVQAAGPKDRARLVSVGRYALRGVARPAELFTLDHLHN